MCETLYICSPPTPHYTIYKTILIYIYIRIKHYTSRPPVYNATLKHTRIIPSPPPKKRVFLSLYTCYVPAHSDALTDSRRHRSQARAHTPAKDYMHSHSHMRVYARVLVPPNLYIHTYILTQIITPPAPPPPPPPTPPHHHHDIHTSRLAFPP